MKKILFLHGFFASGQCVPAVALQDAFEGRAEVQTPDLPMHPKEAVGFVRELIDKEEPDVLVGNSCGSFLAQMIAPTVLLSFVSLSWRAYAYSRGSAPVLCTTDFTTTRSKTIKEENLE